MAKVSTLKMDKRITFVDLVKPDSGYPMPDWATEEIELYKCWARVFTTKQDIVTILGESTATKTFLRFVIRTPRSFIPTTKHKLKFNGKQYNITSALNDDYENDTMTVTVEGLGVEP